ncbi:hypothetical protein ACQJBY_021780 [Aegilops geniculata]
MESSLCTASRATVTGARAAPGAGMRRRRAPARASTSGRWRPRALRAQASAREPETLAPAKGGQPELPWTALRVGAGVALALALGGASWSARGGGTGAVLVQPAMVYMLNAVTDGTERGGTPAAAVRTSVGALSDSLFRREDAPRENATLMDLVFEQVTKEVPSLLVQCHCSVLASHVITACMTCQ